ncbi:MAG: MarR family winged helix-turn-helix transcriptional regulator [Opitutales bacterium]
MKQNVKRIDNKGADLNLYQLLERGFRSLESALVAALVEETGYRISPADLRLLANLDCGRTYASELARRLGVSRQAINQLLRNLLEQDLVRLETVPNRRTTKWIVITDAGAALINRALHWLDEWESLLGATLGADARDGLRRSLAWMTDGREAPR